MTEAEKRAKRKYVAKVRRFVVDVYPKDTELLEWLSRQEKPQSYIKELIRQDMAKCNGDVNQMPS